MTEENRTTATKRGRIRRWQALIAALTAAATAAAAGCGTGAPDGTPAGTATEDNEMTTAAEETAPVKVTGDIAPEAADEVPAAYDAGAEKLNVGWKAGYVGSDTNPDYAYTLYRGGGAYAYSDVIEMGPRGTKLVFADPQRGSTSRNAFCVSSWVKKGGIWVIDRDGFNIAGMPGTVVSSDPKLGTVYTYISDKDGECIRFSFRDNGTASGGSPAVYMSRTDGKSTVGLINDEAEDLAAWIKADTERSYISELEGLTAYYLGDSYFAGNGVGSEMLWPALLAGKYSMNYVNQGINGSAVSAYAPNNHPMVLRWDKLPAGDPDFIVFEGGRNDYNQNVPLGNDGSTDTMTYKGALRGTIEGLRGRYPNAVLICMTSWEVGGRANSQGLYCGDYSRAMIKVCGDMGVPVIDATDQAATGVRMTDPAFRAEYCMTPSDISHLNPRGMRLVMPFFEAKIAGFLKK